MDAAACRSQLERMLRDQTALLQLLARQLESEHALLKANDIEGLEGASGARQDTVLRLLRLEDERRHLCQLLGRGDDNEAMAGLLRWCDPAGSLAEVYRSSSELAQRCREQNDRNGALVAARLQRISGMLDAVDNDRSAPGVYGPRGSSGGSAPRTQGRVLTLIA